MKAFLFLVMTLIGAFGLITTSCISDSITNSPSDILVFSRDTVNFDTVFTDVGTPTARLVVRNPAKKGLYISSIRLRDRDSRFSINVDGTSGRDFTDVEIRGRDSILVFIECFIPPTSADEPFLTEDALEFVTNGVTQSVRLEAYGQNVTRLRNERVSTDTRFSADRPYVVFDSLVVEKGATLTLSPGTRMLFHDGAEMILHGTLLALGEPGHTIRFRGDRLDDILPDVGYDIMAGQWKGIRMSGESSGNRLEFVDMRSTKNGLSIEPKAGEEESDAPRLSILNSWLHNSESTVLRASGADVAAMGSCFSEAADAVVSLADGSAAFTQCTIANNYLFSAITSPLLDFPSDEKTGKTSMNAEFRNCVIYGLVRGISDINYDETGIFFQNVSYKENGVNNAHFIDCLWNCDPLFLTDRAEYIFDYRVREDSPVIGKGNPAFVTSECRYDMDGVDRLASGNPTLGAYAR